MQPVFPLCFVPSLYLILCSCAFYDFLKHFEKPSICCQPIKNRIHIDAIDWFHFQFSVDDMFRCMWCALAGERAIFIAAAYILLSTGSNLENSGNSTSLSHAATSNSDPSSKLCNVPCLYFAHSLNCRAYCWRLIFNVRNSVYE